VNAKDRYGFTALHIACQSDNIEAVVIESLLDHKDINLTETDRNGNTPLHEACLHGHMEIVEVLLKKIAEKNQDVTKVNIKNNAGLTPFHIACREDHHKIVKLLLDKYPKLLKECDNDKATPLHYACRNDNIDTVRLLMQKSSSLYEFLTPRISDGVTPIHVAAQYGCVKVMEEFLSLKLGEFTVDVKDTYNQTPLHFATEYGKMDMMALLIKR
jgi:ankyrin